MPRLSPPHDSRCQTEPSILAHVISRGTHRTPFPPPEDTAGLSFESVLLCQVYTAARGVGIMEGVWSPREVAGGAATASVCARVATGKWNERPTHSSSRWLSLLQPPSSTGRMPLPCHALPKSPPPLPPPFRLPLPPSIK